MNPQEYGARKHPPASDLRAGREALTGARADAVSNCDTVALAIPGTKCSGQAVGLFLAPYDAVSLGFPGTPGAYLPRMPTHQTITILVRCIAGSAAQDRAERRPDMQPDRAPIQA